MLIKNKKVFLQPPNNGSETFKDIFMKAASAGVGRTVDDSGFPEGSWTPILLAQAISELPENTEGVELRTVQLWFQDNQRGISANSIRWIARVFGCDDANATVEWQAALSAAQSRQVARRRRHLRGAIATTPEAGGEVQVATLKGNKQHEMRNSLAAKSEQVLSASPLNIASLVFAGAVGLGLLSYFLNIHDVLDEFPDGTVKQVGFLWAPNWTLLFLIFMPLFFIFLAELLAFWKANRQSRIVSQDSIGTVGQNTWLREVETHSATFWVVLVICALFAGILQWVFGRLLPLLNGQGDVALDWGLYAIDHPEVISVPASIALTGFAYLYMSLCFYLFMAGLILLYTVIHDFLTNFATKKDAQRSADQQIVDKVTRHIMVGLYRCTILSTMIAICMKLQSSYLSSDGLNIVTWLVDDIGSVFHEGSQVVSNNKFKQLNHFSSLILVMASTFVFFYGAAQLGLRRQNQALFLMMIATNVLLVVSYMLIGTFDGFSILLGLAVSIALFGMAIPSFGLHQTSKAGG